ncbi:TlpA family protein disulfide reductase [Eudoraea sp.]|uniref:TlpA family protein disulfide reductase n=1 Tax=Eudoraea sp. TaxID=1979955 RepID=UPI003C76D44C
MQKTLLYFLILIIASCNTAKKDNSTVYFAGEIVNPTNDQILLFKGDMVIDSAKLDGENRFAFQLNSLDEGLYHFYHAPEEQYVYIEKGDSLQIRLNTVDFDESLVFSGSNDAINNFLVELFLTMENENELVYKWYDLEPVDFIVKVDSLRNLKLETLDVLVQENDLSPSAYELAQAGIMYGSYITKEAYPFYHKKKVGDKKIHDLPDNFYDYRSQINYDGNGLTYYRPYYNFMKYHFGNLSYMSCKNDCDMRADEMHDKLHFNQHKLKLIDSLVPENELRDNLFRNVALDYLLKYDSEENIETFIDDFQRLSGNNRHMREINNLYQGIRNLQPQNDLPEVWVQDIEGNLVSLQEIGKDKEVVFYFWSGPEQKHFHNMNRRINYLKEKYPNYMFVGLNVRTDKARWKNLIEVSDLDKSQQYWTNDFENIAHTLVIYDPNRGIITKDGKIVNAFANVYNSFP